MREKIVGSVVLISVVAIIVFVVFSGGFQGVLQVDGLETYVGTLVGGSSYFHNGESIVEMNFEDGKTFTCAEQLAQEANVEIGKTYQISYNSTNPAIALKIMQK